MEAFPLIYFMVVVIMAEAMGSFRKCGWWGAFLLLFFLTPILGIPLILLFPRHPKAYCIKDYLCFHAGVAYRFKKDKQINSIKPYIVINDREERLSEYEFTEYFIPVESYGAYMRRRRADGKTGYR